MKIKSFLFFLILLLLLVLVGCVNQDFTGKALGLPSSASLSGNIESNCTREICDGIDNDCDKFIDEGQLCPNGKDCLNGKCQTIEKTQNELETTINSHKPNYKGYIIELKDEPVVVYKKKIEGSKIAKSTIPNKINEYRTNLLNVQNTLKTKIKQLVPSSKVIGEYKNVFNGFALDISDQEIQKIKQLPEVKKVSLNYEAEINLNDAVPLINADDVWQLQDSSGNNITGKDITIAIIDTGMDYTHPDLGGCFGPNCKVVDGYDFVNNDSDPMDDHGHGTHVAGIAASTGNGSNGVLKGVAPDAKLYAYKVISSYGSGLTSNVIAAIERATDPNQDNDTSDHVDIISMSLGVSYKYFNDCYDIGSSTAVDNAVDAGITVIIAAGNDGLTYSTIGAPGCAKKAITVGASDKQDISAYFTSKGPTNDLRIKPDVVAPGVNICAPQWDSYRNNKCFDDKHISLSGTSMSTPIVAGAVALIKQAHGDWTPEEIKMALRNTAKLIGYDDQTGLNYKTLIEGYGRINVLKAVQLNLKPPIAKINTSGVFNEDIINITGTASSDNFKSYTLYYGNGIEPTEWTQIYSSTTPVNEGSLYDNFDTSSFDQGVYILKLIVEDNGNSVSEDKTMLAIDKTVYRNGWPVILNAGSDFPSKAGLYSPIIGNVDNTGDLEIVVGTQKGEIYVFDSNGNIMPGWPLNLGKIQGVPALADLDNDGDLEIMFGASSDSTNSFYAFNYDGTLVNGWPQSVDYSSITSPAVGDIDKDGGLEVVVGSGDKVYAWHYNGTLVNGWPKQTNGGIYGTPALADLDNDNLPEIVVASQYNLYVWNYDGSLLNNFPVELGSLYGVVVGNVDNNRGPEIIISSNYYLYVIDSSGTVLPGWPYNMGTRGIPSLIDIDNDGYLEIFISSENKVLGLNYAGSVLNGWPQYTEREAKNEIVFGNVDDDNSLEIIAISNLYKDIHQDIFLNAVIHAWNSDGTLAKNFPKKIRDTYNLIYNYSYSSPTIEDLDHDGDNELIYSYFYNDSGGLGFSYNAINVIELNSNHLVQDNLWPRFQQNIWHTGLYGYCIDNTSHGQCSTTKPLYCDNGILINKCQSCGCPSSKPYCNSTTNLCEAKCSDGTLFGQCSTTKPLYCSNGRLIGDCFKCGCPDNGICKKIAGRPMCQVPVE